MNELLEAQVPLSLSGKRCDAALAQLFPQFSRARIAEWIKQGQALVDGRSLRPRDPVRAGELVRLQVEHETVTADAPEAIAIDILREDPAFFVLAKPAGLVVHPGAGNRSGTLVNALLHRDPALSALPRAGVVHRLDKDTSGVMVVARTLQCHHHLVKALARREVRREYLALVLGQVIAGGSIEAPIGRHPGDRLRMAVVDSGKPALSHYRIEERLPAHTLLRVQLASGRTHQIRVHLAHLRMPIIGDPLYGGPLRLPAGASSAVHDALRGFRRQALHAETLVFAHPDTGEEVKVSTPPPADFTALLATLRAEARRSD